MAWRWRLSLHWLKRRIAVRISHLKSLVRLQCLLIPLTIKSLFYNEHLDRVYALDTAMEPLFWFVDHFTQALGPIFVFLVVVTLFAYVVIAYVVGLPFWWPRSRLLTVLALVIGNWLLVNVSFNYYMALSTSPGHPPDRTVLREVTSICKKCIAPKPPRAHHCSVCNKCILKMDHHCRESRYRSFRYLLVSCSH